MIKLVKQSENTKNIVVMAGNVANPETFKLLAEVGADYIRVSVGSGDACTTAVNLGVYYPMASLINDCYYYKLLNKKLNDHETKIVADGGFKTMSQIIKALALGADYVMLGSMLNSCADSAGRIVLHNDHHYKEYYGMASKEGMEKLGKTGHYAPEGKIVYNTITDKVSIFSENLAAYIRSAMSYCDAYTLD
ncbi:MAG: hypothetical protein EOM87_09605, partial [Clostridia bacterium]|nr:hypothetical protein [Clostridia bacterium]